MKWRGSDRGRGKGREKRGLLVFATKFLQGENSCCQMKRKIPKQFVIK